LTPPRRLEQSLPGETVASLERQGKYLLMVLGEGKRLLLHLGMTGQLFMAGVQSPRLVRQAARGGSNGEAADPHTHLLIEFEDGAAGLRFRDVRKCGKVRLLGPGQSDARLDKLGPDALQADGAQLYAAAHHRRIPIKTLLLDQSVLAGVGNIYADEALFRAGVRPTRSAGRVTRKECQTLAERVRAVLLRSIETGGSSISDYVAPDGSDGQFQNERRVYARAGEACSSCGSEIRRIVLGQRSSHYCPSCQS
jgi:formamidopyrimidine-DNA glycosylase